jgi:type II secretory pathway pseudopilin PulG
MTRIPDVADPEGGYTLTEVLGALLILTVAVMAILSAIGTSIIASDVQRKLVTEDAVVRAYAEALNAAPYVDCATPATGGYSTGTVLPNLATKWPGYQTSIVTVGYWNGDNPATFGAACTSDTGVQRLQLEAHSTPDRGVQHLDIVKRRPS